MLSFRGMARFVDDETAAVTVDWVVITASLVGLGVGTASLVSVGTGNLGEQVRISLSSALVASLATPTYEILRLTAEQLAQWTQTFAEMTNEQLIAQVHLRLEQFQTHLDARQWTQAQTRADYYHLISLEMQARGLPMPAGVPTDIQLRNIYLAARG